MYYKKIFMDDSGFLSYLIGCPVAKVACVVDPVKGDVHEYIAVAEKHGMVITHIFDTQEEADHLGGNMELKLRTGAEIYHLNPSTVRQVNRNIAGEGDIFDFGSARIEIINSPNHDPFVNSIMLTDTCSHREPWLILKRNSLFVGDIGTPDLKGRELVDRLNTYLDADGEASDESVSCPEMDYNEYHNYRNGAEYAQFSVG